ncbi:type II toxin-antitoxin system PrlF family antitoxin [Legionella birminghamensis]|uniref:Putative regulator n=1 Tax=Legionella birminghamensis TaxID=28083 RepID=A0A378IB80_9GAMM|nr:type II toxin-antitoxin system PrlF family antitoxin [Legionella birminghamensis]STX32156.1 putative regulator [Legionella birminghamensis]
MTRAKKPDPITVEFLNFIAKDILNNSKILTTINQDLLTRIQSLVANVEV